jgi:hypothetical protein
LEGYLVLQPKILNVEALSDYRLKLKYETGEVKVFDVTPYISGSWYGELQNQSYFNAVRLLKNRDGIEWPNGQDLAPHELYEFSIPIIH